jgi:hypothetical protein
MVGKASPPLIRPVDNSSTSPSHLTSLPGFTSPSDSPTTPSSSTSPTSPTSPHTNTLPLALYLLTKYPYFNFFTFSPLLQSPYLPQHQPPTTTTNSSNLAKLASSTNSDHLFNKQRQVCIPPSPLSVRTSNCEYSLTPSIAQSD